MDAVFYDVSTWRVLKLDKGSHRFAPASGKGWDMLKGKVGIFDKQIQERLRKNTSNWIFHFGHLKKRTSSASVSAAHLLEPLLARHLIFKPISKSPYNTVIYCTP